MNPASLIRFVADEDFNNRIIRGLLRRKSDLDILRIQDTSLSGQDDQSILEWASRLRVQICQIIDLQFARLKPKNTSLNPK